MSVNMEEETYESDNDSEFWYESDLQLAAELGKTLLEKNKELESQLNQSQQVNHEQSLEIEFLTKQLEILRDVNESRLKIYEEIEKNSHELEKANQKLTIEAKSNKQHIQRLSEVVESLESKCSDLEDVVKEYKRAENTKTAYEKLRRALSVPSLTDACDVDTYIGDYYSLSFSRHAIPLNKYEVEIRKLKDNNRNLKARLRCQERKTDEADFELALLLEENGCLKEKVEELEKSHQEAKTFQHDRHESSTDKRCSSCSKKRQATEKNAGAETNPELSIEHDDVHEEIKNGEVIKMKNGGSAYGSREALNKVGIEVDTDASQNLSHGTPSLLGELDAQYSTLIAKYEALVEAKSRRKASKNMQVDTSTFCTSHKEVQTSVLYHKELTAYRSRHGHHCRASRSDSPPEYKKLFMEIFDTLKKSAIYEDEASKDQTASATRGESQCNAT